MQNGAVAACVYCLCRTRRWVALPPLPGQNRLARGPSIWAACGIRERTLLEEGTMAEIERISVADARNKVQGKQALLVCAYPDEAKFRAARLDGAISLASFEARAASLPKGQEIIFYCA